MSDLTDPDPAESAESAESVAIDEAGSGTESVDDDPVGYLDTAADPWAAV